ncbi:MAG: HlyD family type I secretion periplasmic adaptor subunit, partial [Betaproteobacteria bacterium HGW-Betaproteobacteria-18]
MAFFNKKAFEGTGSLIKHANKVSENTFGSLVKRLTPVEEPEHLDWAGDADWARLQQEPLRARSLLRLAAAALARSFGVP